MKTVKRRRKESKTNYSRRLKLLKSEKPRLVFRKTNKLAIVQYVESFEAKDKVIFGVTSKILLKNGWPEDLKGSLKGIPATYLTGYYVGKKILKDKLETPIVDLGMQRVIHKTRIFSFIKGLIDAGLPIPSKEEAFPEEERINGSSMKKKVDLEKIKLQMDKI
jgi:large subunit ribosomal protein L18